MESVVITGIGAVTALGQGVEALFSGLMEGRTGMGPIRAFDAAPHRVQTAAGVDVLPELELSHREKRRMSRCDRLAVAAAEEALADASIPSIHVPHDRIALIFGAGAGGMLETEAYFRDYLRRGSRSRARPGCLGSQQPNAAGDWIAARLPVRGPKATISTACSSSATAIGYGADLIRDGEADLVITGGAEALCEITFAGFNALRAVDPRGCRPFDRDRNGMSLGEGAAVLVLESASQAARRGVRPHAAFLGYGITADAHHMTNPPEDAAGAVAALRQALRTSGISADAVDLVNAHGTGTRANDLAEGRAIATVLGERSGQVPVHSAKSSVGHCLGAAGAIEAVVTVLSLERGEVPPTYGLECPDEDLPPLDLVRGAPRTGEFRVGVSHSFAFGGNNTVLIFGRPHGEEEA